MRNFELLEPRSVDEASRMLEQSGEEARLYAGGSALMLAMRQRLVSPSHLVYLGGVAGLDGIRLDQGRGLCIGALARHADLAQSSLVRARFPMLATMAAHLADPQVRNQGTLGGNLCYADPATDPPTCLMALDASVAARDPQGEREIALDEFFTDYYQTALRPSEVVFEVRVPPMPADTRGAYTRWLRTPADHRPLVNVAVVVALEGRICRRARIAIGASVPIATRARRAEAFLEGRAAGDDVLEEVARIAAGEVEVISDFRAGADYRRHMIRVAVRRTARAALQA